MTVLILSDTHKNRDRLKKVLELHRNADAIIHLGDGYGDFAGFDLGDTPFTASEETATRKAIISVRFPTSALSSSAV